MPNLRRSIVGDLSELGPPYVGARGIYLQASDGRTFTITRLQILAHFASETGTKLQKKIATLVWLKSKIQDALGVEQIQTPWIDTDFDDTDGTPNSLTFTLPDEGV